MPDTRWSAADVHKYLAEAGRPLAPGSMALEEEPGSPLRAEGTGADDRVQQPNHDASCETLPAHATEDELLAAIRKLAKANGWELYHTYNSERSEPGWPDTVITDGVSLLIYELKNNTRKPTPAQEVWLSLLAHTSRVECGIWRPQDWPKIVARLTRKAPLSID